ncbi:hypothetical protein [Rhodoplanes roseus]|uniref:Uncharacterized protein n=1 Tax=Rhodoplanes roseus TaxID=29409 RepID=A0A327L0I3_9BRAD|nr:hypothetical protein [Rhodoplanes roseus]RAI43907.1 hypothetical protein CH341_11835 [Rhodoplanes roseus]
MNSATVIDLSAYRARRRAAATAAAAPGTVPVPGFVGFVLVPTPVMMMWTPVWFPRAHASTGHE